MINYTIEPKENGYRLTVWEPAPLTSDRVNPFFFKASYFINSPLEAFKLLKVVQGGSNTVRSSIPGQLANALMRYQKTGQATP